MSPASMHTSSFSASSTTSFHTTVPTGTLMLISSPRFPCVPCAAPYLHTAAILKGKSPSPFTCREASNPHVPTVAPVTPVSAPSAFRTTIFHEAHCPGPSVTSRDDHASAVDEGFVFPLVIGRVFDAPNFGRRLREGGRTRGQSTQSCGISYDRNTPPNDFTEARHSPGTRPSARRGSPPSVRRCRNRLIKIREPAHEFVNSKTGAVFTNAQRRTRARTAPRTKEERVMTQIDASAPPRKVQLEDIPVKPGMTKECVATPTSSSTSTRLGNRSFRVHD